MEVLWSESWLWLKRYIVGYVLLFFVGVTHIEFRAILFPPIAEINVTLLSAIATCTGIAFTLVSLFLFRLESVLRVSAKFSIAFLNAFHLSTFAYFLYVLASREVPYEVQRFLVGFLHLLPSNSSYGYVFASLRD